MAHEREANMARCNEEVLRMTTHDRRGIFRFWTPEETSRGRGARYGMAVLTVVVALILVIALQEVLPFPARMLFVVPVAIASRYGGRGPAVIAASLGVVAINFSIGLTTLDRSASTTGEPWIYALLFAVIAFTIDSSSQALRRARADAERRSAELEALNKQLAEHMEEVQALSEHLNDVNASLAEARDDALDASRAREEVLAVVAHDLRNPLNLVMMTAQLFSEIEPSPEQRQHLLDVMLRASRRMNRLIEDLLEVVRIDAGRLTLDLKAVPATSILAQTAEMFQFAANQKGVSLIVDDASPDARVSADEERVVQAMGNLVGNALKFVDREGRVRLQCVRDGGQLRFAVIDSGQGMTPDQLERLFEKFWQARRSDRRGVGLGLTIARGIVEAHGGRIWAESRLGRGSSFYFTLPAAQQAAVA
jgi:signal transduction histidine kinase